MSRWEAARFVQGLGVPAALAAAFVTLFVFLGCEEKLGPRPSDAELLELMEGPLRADAQPFAVELVSHGTGTADVIEKGSKRTRKVHTVVVRVRQARFQWRVACIAGGKPDCGYSWWLEEERLARLFLRRTASGELTIAKQTFGPSTSEQVKVRDGQEPRDLFATRWGPSHTASTPARAQQERSRVPIFPTQTGVYVKSEDAWQGPSVLFKVEKTGVRPKFAFSAVLDLFFPVSTGKAP